MRFTTFKVNIQLSHLLRYGMVVLHIQAYNSKHCTRLPKCYSEIKQIIYYDGLLFSIAKKHHECK